MNTFRKYFMNLNVKIDRQYDHLLNEFKSFVIDLIKELDKGNISSAIAHLISETIVPREKSTRKPQPRDEFSPSYVKFAKPKKIKSCLIFSVLMLRQGRKVW